LQAIRIPRCNPLYKKGLLNLLKSFTCLLNSLNDTQRLGKVVSEIVSKISANIVTLQGDLGTGKTTLCKSIVNHYLGQELNVNSPTFTLLNIYETSKKRVYHYDLYRLKHENELLELGIEEAILSEALILFEWPQIAKNYLAGTKGILEVKLFLDIKANRKAEVKI
jgi:tRNA threonylcarbamoyladenosine biosynthesis protein TsaE